MLPQLAVVARHAGDAFSRAYRIGMDTPRVTIRAASAADFDVWLPLWQAYLRFYKADLSHETTLTTWARLLDGREPMHAALADVERRTVGIVHFIEHRSCWTTGNYMYLQDLFVAAAVRGSGVGGALIAHVYAEAASRGCSRVWWLTHESNQQARLLYDRVAEASGFVQYRKVL
jgi:GNAT superfamily N-acetyltransferase